MKVIHIIAAPAAGGAEVYVKDLVLNSMKSGMTPFLLFASHAKDIGRCEKYEAKFLTELTDNGIGFTFLPVGSRRNAFKGSMALRQLLKIINPDIIHSHLLTGVVHKLLSFSSIPLIYTHHNSVINTNPYLFAFLLKFCDGHIGISKICSNVLEKYLKVNKKVTTIFNAVDLNRLSISDGKVLVGEQINLLAVGSLTAQKNYPLVINAIKRIRENSTKKFHLNIAGEGEQKELLINLVSELKLNDTISFLGNRSDIPQLMSESDLFIMSSDWEGLPIALIEAQLLGLAAIVTDVGGCSEVIYQTGGGVLTPKGDTVKLAENIESFFDYSVLFKFSENAKKNSSCYEITKAVESHKKYYSSFLFIDAES
jgi:glycosyltransferase involved in cell wall biosynthesis